MSIDIEKERANFEAACRQHAKDAGYDDSERLERDGDGYTDLHTQAAWWAWQARAALQSQDREDAADMFWDADDTEDCLYACDEEDAVKQMVEKVWPTDFPLHFTLQRAVRLPDLNIKVISMSDCGTDIQYERETIDHARRIEDKT